ncbi:hypothetical protein QBC39DRAFT_436319 [Podospora conica]|nr:hypothetical protein QBC39DRAFT_436319 [Schizothecium conicum]
MSHARQVSRARDLGEQQPFNGSKTPSANAGSPDASDSSTTTTDNSTLTTEGSPADHNPFQHHPKSRVTDTSPISRKAIFRKKTSERHFPELPVHKDAVDRLENWKGVYRERLEGMLEKDKRLGRDVNIDGRLKLEHWGIPSEKPTLYLVFYWPARLSKPLDLLLEEESASDQAVGIFKFRVEEIPGERWKWLRWMTDRVTPGPRLEEAETDEGWSDKTLGSVVQD